jgi:hypothetical protein
MATGSVWCHNARTMVGFVAEIRGFLRFLARQPSGALEKV